MAYLAWPVALFSSVSPRPDASQWFRVQLKQALWFGNLSVAIGLLALAWPLIVASLIGSTVATLWIYGLAIAIDLTLFVLWLLAAIRYSQAAGRGELFEVPVVSRIARTASSK